MISQPDKIKYPCDDYITSNTEWYLPSKYTEHSDNIVWFDRVLDNTEPINIKWVVGKGE